jgi:hypothetical protein
MLRMGSWKLLFDHEGHGELYDLCSDPMELNDRWNDPGCSSQRQRLVEELLRWTIRTEDDLPAGPYQAKRPAPLP